MTLSNQQVCDLAGRFVSGPLTQTPRPFGNGHINDTYVFFGDG